VKVSFAGVVMSQAGEPHVTVTKPAADSLAIVFPKRTATVERSPVPKGRSVVRTPRVEHLVVCPAVRMKRTVVPADSSAVRGTTVLKVPASALPAGQIAAVKDATSISVQTGFTAVRAVLSVRREKPVLMVSVRSTARWV